MFKPMETYKVDIKIRSRCKNNLTIKNNSKALISLHDNSSSQPFSYKTVVILYKECWNPLSVDS